MWRLYVGGLFTGFAIGGAVCWLFVLLIIPESARGYLLTNSAFPWMVLPAFVLAGENLRVKGKKNAASRTGSDPVCNPGGPA
jgi:hypothetical protein